MQLCHYKKEIQITTIAYFEIENQFNFHILKTIYKFMKHKFAGDPTFKFFFIQVSNVAAVKITYIYKVK
jgi:hypothetical protein